MLLIADNDLGVLVGVGWNKKDAVEPDCQLLVRPACGVRMEILLALMKLSAMRSDFSFDTTTRLETSEGDRIVEGWRSLK